MFRSSRKSQTLSERFAKVFRDNEWGDAHSVSGEGSRLDANAVRQATEALEMMIERYGVRSIVDVPCGDFTWMPGLLKRYPHVSYHGCDIVPELVDRNDRAYSHHKFSVLDITKQIPPYADLFFCKDLVNHLLSSDVVKVLRNAKRSGCRYFLMTNNSGWENEELPENYGGLSRHVDLMKEPYSLQPPLWSNDYLAMWRFDAFPPSFFDDLCYRLSK